MLLFLDITLIFVGAVIGAQPFFTFNAIIQLPLPLILGITILWKGIIFSHFEVVSGRGIIMGLCIAFLGLTSFLSRLRCGVFWVLFILAIWGFGRAGSSFRRVMKGWKAVHDGFINSLLSESCH